VVIYQIYALKNPMPAVKILANYIKKRDKPVIRENQ